MSMFRRIGMANFGKIAAGGGTHTLTVGSKFITGGDFCITALYGYVQSDFGSISPTTQGGFTIDWFYFADVETLQGFFPNESCQPSLADTGFTYRVSGYSGTQTGLFTSFTYQKSGGGTVTLNSSSALYNGFGEWFWVGTLANYQPASGAVTFV